ncbi:hypothetical protein OHA61_04300 [Streptomyces sp. NBC_00885]|uniref:hypothetical protein n=1 Tax=Streptomyces sp. NBC_00885 TaxID=2975857 RepID=UPI00386418C3|nr:hypothetical protein OHA61_04300 [Streptomyces sp. NBC_00885]
MVTVHMDATTDDGLIAALGGCTVLECRVRVVRTDGWSWGPDPSELARGAVAMLPRVVEMHLAGALARTGVSLPPPVAGQDPHSGFIPQDMEVTVPVHIRSFATLDELAGAAPMTDRTIARGSGPDATVLPHRGHADPSAPGTTPLSRQAGSDAGSGTDARAEALPGPGRPVPPALAFDRDQVLVGLLNEASACGAFETVLAGLPHEALLLLLRALDAAGSRPAPGPGAAADAADAATPFPGRAGAVPCEARDPDPDALAAALMAALRYEPPVWTDTTLRATHTPLTATGPEPAPDSALPALPARIPPAPGRAEQHHAGPAPGTVTDIDRVLPFLLLPPLHDRGYLEAAAAVLSGGGAQAPDGAAFAACLAHKVLPPPAHGWLRSPQDTHAVAVFAGTTTTGHAAPDISALDLERHLGPLLALLDSRLGLQTAQGHTATSPLLLRAVAPGRLLLLDVDGLYPVWDATKPAELLRPWELAGTPLVLLPSQPDAPAAGGLTLALDALGIGFVTDLPPARGEQLSRVPAPRRCWTNTGARLPFRSAPDDALVGAARRLTYEASRAARFTEALVELRPAVRGQAPAVERTVTLAAAVALADLSWKLWSEREPSDPMCALDRFADLGARVAFHDSTVEVRLPLGARHSDLYRHRLLADVPDVPWFGGRTVVFTGG